MSDRDPSKERVNELFEYRDGKLYNKTNRANRSRKGQMAGSHSHRGYSRTCINRKLYLLHRLIYIMHNGDIEEGYCIDHMDGDTTNNRIDNLRMVNHQENQFNRPTAKGYCWNKERQKYSAQIFLDGKNKYLGLFDKEEDAIKARADAKEIYHPIKER